MEQTSQIKINEKLFLKNPEEHILGRKIINQGLLLINKLGYEHFTFKKLALEIQTTEAGIYRYFENKHKFLIYLISVYWHKIDLKVQIVLNDSHDPELKLKSIIRLLVVNFEHDEFILEKELHKLIIWEGAKTYHSRNVNNDNQNQLFKPYKDLCARISNVINELNSVYPYSHSLASSLIEIAHAQMYFREHLPSLTDFNETKKNEQLISFLETMLMGSIRYVPSR